MPTIRLTQVTYSKLESLKIIPQEPYHAVIERLIKLKESENNV